jgi:isoleucyl-tRNA synthetase
LAPGREKFLAEVHKWVEEYGGKICTQMRRLGTSCDWSRQAYTMDDQLSAAVKEAFLRMHADGLIYRDVRLVNWDCRLKTAVSESEVSAPPPLLPHTHPHLLEQVSEIGSFLVIAELKVVRGSDLVFDTIF